jgi:hypothetical protein
MAHEDGVNCTAQHVPTGSLLIYGDGVPIRGAGQRDTISTLDIAPSILKFFGFERPAYMRGTPSMNFGV